MKRNRDFGLSIGAPSIVVIMVILCLVCFAGLSIVSANADLTLSRKLAERTSAYYQACNEAQEDLLEASKKEPLEDSFSCDYVMNENQILSVNASFLETASGVAGRYHADTGAGSVLTGLYWQLIRRE